MDSAKASRDEAIAKNKIKMVVSLTFHDCLPLPPSSPFFFSKAQDAENDR